MVNDTNTDNKKDNRPAPSAPTDERQLPTSNEISIPPTEGQGKNNFPTRTCPALQTMDAKTLLQVDLPPIQFVVEGLLPQGLFILAGSPKVGKSWLSLLLCHTVAVGGRFWGRNALQGTVLYLALEDSLSRLQSRYSHYSAEGSPNLHFATRAQTLKDGLNAQVKHFITKHPDTRLVVIDTMQHIRGAATDKNSYVNDYHDMNILREVTSEFDLALLLVTHTRKMEDSDPLNRISGSTGLIGATDGAFILEKEARTSNQAHLTVTNRDTDTHTFQLEFDKDACRWNLLEEEIPQHREEPLYSFLLAFMADKRSWEGSATELAEHAQAHGTAYTHASIGRKLRDNEQLLFNKYKLEFRFSTKNNTRRITITNLAIQ